MCVSMCSSDHSFEVKPRFIEKLEEFKQKVNTYGIDLNKTPMEIEYTRDGIAYRRIENYPSRPTIIFLHHSLGCIKM